MKPQPRTTQTARQGDATPQAARPQAVLEGTIAHALAATKDSPWTSDVMVARRFVVVNEAGAPQADFGYHADGSTRLDFWDANGVVRMSLKMRLHEDGTHDDIGFTLADAQGVYRFGCAINCADSFSAFVVGQKQETLWHSAFDAPQKGQGAPSKRPGRQCRAGLDSARRAQEVPRP